MHQALRIDEILQLIFDFCSDLPDTRPRWTYAQLARCCKTWTDPALDRLWRRMDGLGPLLALLPTMDDEPTVDVTPSFEAAAKRVRQILHTKSSTPSFRLPDGYGPNVFPNLEAATLSHSGCLIPHIWRTSERIQRVSVSLSFSRKETDAHIIAWNDAVARYLEKLRVCAPHFHCLQVRGSIFDSLNATVASLSQLRSLTIQSSRFLTSNTLAAIATFPALRMLEVHADHIRGEEFEDCLSSLHPDDADAMSFPALEELTIRTSGLLLTVLLTRLPVGVMKKLHLDMVMDAHPRTDMKSVLELLAQKAAGSLRDLLLDDRTERDSLAAVADPNANAEDATSDAHSQRGYTLDDLAPLARVRQLRSFVLKDADLVDGDLEVLARWWPELERLELGANEDVCMSDHEHEHDEGTSQHGCKTRLSPAAYALVARSFRLLESLSLSAPPPRALEVTTFVAQVTSLAVGDARAMPGYTADAAPAVVDALLAIFPALKRLDSPDTEVIERFETALADSRT